MNVCRVLVAALLACGSPSPPPQAPPPPHDPTATPVAPGTRAPRLVVLLVIDQLPQWSFAQKRPALTKGFARLLREGAWHVGEHPSAATLTGPGHALLGTGEPTWRSGIVGNEWWDRSANKVVRAAEDLDGKVSPVWLTAPGLGDALAAAGTGGKAVSVALKDRAAVLLLGKTGTAIYYEPETGTWHSTGPSSWLAAHDKANPVRARLGEPWTPLLGATALARLTGTVDDAPGEVGEKGFGKTFPHVHTATKQPLEAIFATPLGNELTLAIAMAALDGEALGTDDHADLLAISLSAHDYVGHGWGHESWEAWDMLLRLDQQLEPFLAALDRRVGKDGWAMIVTSDHGASPAPAAHGGGAITYESIKDAANGAAVTQLGPGEWIAYAKYPSVYLSAAALARPPKELNRALTKIVYALRSYPGLARVELTRELAGNCDARTGDAYRYCISLHRERSGEVFFVPKPYWIFEDRPGRFATAHGSLHAFDREVPLVFLPPGRREHAPVSDAGSPVDMTRVAGVLATYLGVAPPSSLPR